MEKITARDFRGEQGEADDDDTVLSKEAFLEKLDRAEKEIAEGRGRAFESADEAIAYFQSLIV